MADSESTRPPTDPATQARECVEKAREFLNAARFVRTYGARLQSAQYLKAARMMRFAAGNWRVRARDDAAGLRWWNSLTDNERVEWMRRAGNTGVAADCWVAFKAVTP